MSLVSYALTSLANLKEHLDIVDNESDTLLTNIINRSTDIIEKYCNGRRFKQTTYTNEEYDGTGTNYINLKHYPVTTLSTYEKNYGTVGDTDWDGLEGDFIKLISDSTQGPGQVFYQGGFLRGIRNYRFTYIAGYSTIPNDLDEACLELSAYLYNNRKSSGLKSETLGEYSYTRDDSIGNVIKDLGLDLVLDQYRQPII